MTVVELSCRARVGFWHLSHYICMRVTGMWLVRQSSTAVGISRWLLSGQHLQDSAHHGCRLQDSTHLIRCLYPHSACRTACTMAAAFRTVLAGQHAPAQMSMHQQRHSGLSVACCSLVCVWLGVCAGAHCGPGQRHPVVGGSFHGGHLSYLAAL